MLAGVGGRTIQEAQQNISVEEYGQWVRYRQIHGPLNPFHRMDMGFSMLATLYANAHRDKGREPYQGWEFMPFATEPEITVEQAMRNWE